MGWVQSGSEDAQVVQCAGECEADTENHQQQRSTVTQLGAGQHQNPGGEQA
ncbi:hypothetical protein D9M73_242460 [compost metagenome]